MNRLGIMIDISHPSKESIMQTLELSRAPVMASHSSARALSDVSRNLDDETLHAIAENGGVVQAVALGTFVSTDKASARREVLAEFEAEVAAEMDFEILGRGQMFRLPMDERDVYRENDGRGAARWPRSGRKRRACPGASTSRTSSITSTTWSI